jgi:hypothetical protein
MQRLPMRFLLLSSVFVVFTGCHTLYRQLKPVGGDPMTVTRLQPAFGVGMYKTSVDVTGKHLSGVLILKKMPDSSLRAVFTSELGFTFFDFQWPVSGGFAVNTIIKQLDKPAVIKTLRKDFEGILMNRLPYAKSAIRTDGKFLYHLFKNKKDNYYYITDSVYNSLVRLERTGKRKKVTTVTMDVSPGHIPDSIHISHHNFVFDIKLKKMNRDVKE